MGRACLAVEEAAQAETAGQSPVGGQHELRLDRVFGADAAPMSLELLDLGDFRHGARLVGRRERHLARILQADVLFRIRLGPHDEIDLSLLLARLDAQLERSRRQIERQPDNGGPLTPLDADPHPLFAKPGAWRRRSRYRCAEANQSDAAGHGGFSGQRPGRRRLCERERTQRDRAPSGKGSRHHWAAQSSVGVSCASAAAARSRFCRKREFLLPSKKA